MQSDDRDYHVQRARAELDSAYSSPSGAAASSHLRLSALHMARARALGMVDKRDDLKVVSA